MFRRIDQELIELGVWVVLFLVLPPLYDFVADESADIVCKIIFVLTWFDIMLATFLVTTHRLEKERKVTHDQTKKRNQQSRKRQQGVYENPPIRRKGKNNQSRDRRSTRNQAS